MTSAFGVWLAGAAATGTTTPDGRRTRKTASATRRSGRAASGMTRHLLGAERNSKWFALQKFAANVYASRAVLTSARPRGSEGAELLRWVAELYYLQEQGQADIAALIGVSISKVSRLLAEARRQGIVTIKVSASRLGESELERELA